MADVNPCFRNGDRVCVRSGDCEGRAGTVVQTARDFVDVQLDGCGKCPPHTRRFANSTVCKTRTATPVLPSAPRPAPPPSVPAPAARPLVRAVDFMRAPVVAYFGDDDVRVKRLGHLRHDSFVAHGGKDLYLELTEDVYDRSGETVHMDHMAIDCEVALFVLNRTFGSTSRQVADLHRDVIARATKAVTARVHLLNPTHETVNTGPKNYAIKDALDAIKTGRPSKHSDIVQTLQDRFATSAAFDALLRRSFGSTYLTRSKTRMYAQNTAEAIQTYAPLALRELRVELGRHVAPVEGLYAAYVDNLQNLMSRMGIVEPLN